MPRFSSLRFVLLISLLFLSVGFHSVRAQETKKVLDAKAKIEKLKRDLEQAELEVKRADSVVALMQEGIRVVMDSIDSINTEEQALSAAFFNDEKSSWKAFQAAEAEFERARKKNDDPKDKNGNNLPERALMDSAWQHYEQIGKRNELQMKSIARRRKDADRALKKAERDRDKSVLLQAKMEGLVLKAKNALAAGEKNLENAVKESEKLAKREEARQADSLKQAKKEEELAAKEAERKEKERLAKEEEKRKLLEEKEQERLKKEEKKRELKAKEQERKAREKEKKAREKEKELEKKLREKEKKEREKAKELERKEKERAKKDKDKDKDKDKKKGK